MGAFPSISQQPPVRSSPSCGVLESSPKHTMLFCFICTVHSLSIMPGMPSSQMPIPLSSLLFLVTQTAMSIPSCSWLFAHTSSITGITWWSGTASCLAKQHHCLRALCTQGTHYKWLDPKLCNPSMHALFFPPLGCGWA